jgi:hypothetical protein
MSDSHIFGFQRSHLHGLCPEILAGTGAQGNDFLRLIRSPERCGDGATDGFVLDSWDRSCSVLLKSIREPGLFDERKNSSQDCLPDQRF